MRLHRLTLSDIAFAVILWALLIVKYGYTYGTNDHIELLPYVLFLKNHLLFPHDLFIQSLNASLPNERTVMAHLLLPFAGHLKTTVFLLHFFNTVLLILALVKITGRFIDNRYISWLVVYVSVLLLNDRGLGNVDLYTPAIQASDTSCMIIAWALNVFLDRKYLFASVLMSAATFIHVLEGFDVMAVLCGVMLVKLMWDKEVSLKQVGEFVGVYVLTAGAYLFFIYRAKTAGGSFMSSHELFEIMFAFRHPHHFIFATFPIINKLLFVFCVLSALLFYRGRSNTLFQFVALGMVGVIAYIVCVDVFHLVFIANFQWYKVVQWIKFLGLVAAYGYVFSYLSAYFADESRIVNYTMISGGLIGVGLMFYGYSIGSFDHGFKQHNEDEISLCCKLKDITPVDAVFVQPFEMTALKFYGQRSSYVEFKAIAKNQKDLRVWYERIQEVFGLNYETDRNGFEMKWKADEHLDNLNEDQLSTLKKEGVTDIICRTGKYQHGHKLILAENGYFVYEL